MSDSDSSGSDVKISRKSRKRGISDDEEDDEEDDFIQKRSFSKKKSRVESDSDSDDKEKDKSDNDKEISKMNAYFETDDEDDEDNDDKVEKGKPRDLSDSESDGGRKKSDGESDEEDIKPKKKKRKDYDDELDDDDLDLLDENTYGVSYHDEEKSGGRLKRRQEMEADREIMEDGEDFEESSFEDEDDDGDFIVGRSGRQMRNHNDMHVARAEEIFGGDLEDFLEDEFYDEDEKEETLALSEVFEPSELKKNKMTVEDNIVRETDIPERLQLLKVNRVENVTDEELEQEAEWIYWNHYSEGYRSNIGEIRVSMDSLPAIVKVLSFFRKDFYEIPFIRTYRKAFYDKKLNDDDLWTILSWDTKWARFYRSRKNLLGLLKKLKDFTMKEDDEDSQANDKKLDKIEDVENLINSSNSVIELTDARSFLIETFQIDLAKITKKTLVKRNVSSIAKEQGLGKLREKFGITIDQLSENIVDDSLINKTTTPEKPPLEIAKPFRTALFKNDKQVLRAAGSIFAHEIACDPKIRERMRKVYNCNAMLFVRPTTKGKSVINETHPCFSFRYLKEKGIKEFEGDPESLLNLFDAEKDGLLKLTFECESGQFEERPFFVHFLKYLCDNESKTMATVTWNAQRKALFAHALKDLMFPIFEKELRVKMLDDAYKDIMDSCASRFKNLVNMKPCVEARKRRENFYVMGISAGDNEVPTMVALVNSDGFVEKTLVLKNFRGRSTPEEKEDDNKALLEMINPERSKFRPRVIGIACEGKDSLMAFTDVQEMLDNINLPEKYRPNVQHISPEIALLYMNSEVALKEYENLPSRMRHAISIARRTVCPLTEVAHLTQIDDDLTMLKLDRNQRFVPREKLNARLLQVLVDTVSTRGVKINDVLKNSNMDGLIQYLPGLGPRKAKAVLDQIKRRGQLFNRSELVTVFEMGATVFTNLAGFINIDEVDRNFSDQGDIIVLDETRIHPESYGFAKKMAKDALEDFNDECVESLLDDEDREEKLNSLDLDTFAEMLQKGQPNDGDRRLLLYDIKDELLAPFKDKRYDFVTIQDNERFELITGQSVDAFIEDKTIVQATVSRVYGGFALCRIDEIIDAKINKRDVSDDMIESVEDVLKVGDIIQAVVKSVEVKQVQLVLSCTPTDIDRANRKALETRDRYFDYDQFEIDEKKDKEQERARRDKMIKRTRRIINHPSFKSFNFKEAEEYLAKLDPGETLIRPSSSNIKELTLTWKVSKDIYSHVRIEEIENKSEQSGEGKWKVKEEYFEDLDEVLARYINPMYDLVSEIKSAPCYHEPWPKPKLDEKIRTERKRNPKRIPYYLSCCVELPGCLMISALPGQMTVKHEYIGLTPEGYKYDDEIFINVPALIKRFKQKMQQEMRNKGGGGGGGSQYNSRDRRDDRGGRDDRRYDRRDDRRGDRRDDRGRDGGGGNSDRNYYSNGNYGR